MPSYGLSPRRGNRRAKKVERQYKKFMTRTSGRQGIRRKFGL